MQDHILVLCRNRSLAGLISRTLRYRQIYSLPLPFETPAEEVLARAPRGVIVASDAFGADALDGFDFSLLTSQTPILALGGAVGVLCRHFGGAAGPASCARGSVTLGLAEDPLFQDVASGEHVLHGFCELTLPEGLSSLATANERPIGFKHAALPLYALQYPIERNDPDSAQLLFNFAASVCGCSASWDEDSIIDMAVDRVRTAAPEGTVLCAVSGGVDSAVCAKLASLAVGDRLKCVFVDTGLFRCNEPEGVITVFAESLNLTVSYVDARTAFLTALSGVSSLEEKERVASQVMTQVLVSQLTHDHSIRTIVMGTNFNDTLFGISPGASLDGQAHAPSVRLCEPVNDLFKDEVRRLAAALALPASIATRQPFPASGLALRIYGQVTEDKLMLLRAADACFLEEIRAGGHDKRLWQFYATLVNNPDRPGGYAVCLRALQASQGGALAARLPFDVLERATQRIRTEVRGITRVVYDLTPSAHYGELE
ncbi:MAG: hypothetical protein MR842_02030 [Clostridiales bacterium]|nr:hypothetical protein [Clostridiales bacterium]MDY4009280.1 hypothetical protein [Candidatus Limiplasma sp.]